MSNEIHSSLSLLESKFRLEKQIREKSKLLDEMHKEKASMRYPSVLDFPGDEKFFYEREEYMLWNCTKKMMTAVRMISEVEDDLAALRTELIHLNEEFMVRTTVEFSLTTNCY